MFTWTCTPSSGNITGWANNAAPTTTLNQTLDNTGFNIETVTYNLTPIANGCSGNITPYVVTIFPTPDLSNTPPSMQLCNNSPTNLTLTSNIAGTSFTWTCTPSSANITGWANNAVPTTVLNQFLTNLGLNTEWVTTIVTPSANGCLGPVTDYTVTVVQSPDVFFNPAAQTICSQQTSNIQVLSSVPGTTFTWTVTPSSPNLSGQAPGSGSLIAQTITNSGNTIEIGDLPGHPYGIWLSAGEYDEYHSHGEPQSHRQQCSDEFPDLFRGQHEYLPGFDRSRFHLHMDRFGVVAQCNRFLERSGHGDHPGADQHRV